MWPTCPTLMTRLPETSSVELTDRWIGMMMSWYGNTFSIMGSLWGESIGHWWIPSQRATNVGLWLFVGVVVSLNKVADDLIPQDTHVTALHYILCAARHICVVISEFSTKIQFKRNKEKNNSMTKKLCCTNSHTYQIGEVFSKYALHIINSIKIIFFYIFSFGRNLKHT